MDNLQYPIVYVGAIEDDKSSFKPYYKWIIFNIGNFIATQPYKLSEF